MATVQRAAQAASRAQEVKDVVDKLEQKVFMAKQKVRACVELQHCTTSRAGLVVGQTPVTPQEEEEAAAFSKGGGGTTSTVPVPFQLSISKPRPVPPPEELARSSLAGCAEARRIRAVVVCHAVVLCGRTKPLPCAYSCMHGWPYRLCLLSLA